MGLAGLGGSTARPATAEAATTASTAAEEWVTCPSVGVPTKVDPILKNGKLICHYFNAKRASELLTTRTLSSSTPWRSCLRSRSNDARVFCSTIKTQAELTAGAYQWARWTAGVTPHTRAKIGGKAKRNGVNFGPRQDLYPCRFKKNGGYRVGYIDGNKCYAPYKGGQASTTIFESLLLTQEYGELRTYGRYGAPVLGLPSLNMVVNGQARSVDRPLCLAYIYPDAFDFQGVKGDLPGVRVLAGVPTPQGVQFVQGGCLSSHNGKELQIPTPSSGNIVLE